MDQNVFLVLNAILIAAILFFIIRARKSQKPTRLDFNSSSRLAESHDDGAADSSGGSRSINVIFQYNGHSWDAFEVLGLTPGTSKGDAERAFDQRLKSAGQDEIAFLRMAIDAIRKS